jgi:hypothetical protein
MPLCARNASTALRDSFGASDQHTGRGSKISPPPLPLPTHAAVTNASSKLSKARGGVIRQCDCVSLMRRGDACQLLTMRGGGDTKIYCSLVWLQAGGNSVRLERSDRSFGVPEFSCLFVDLTHSNHKDNCKVALKNQPSGTHAPKKLC